MKLAGVEVTYGIQWLRDCPKSGQRWITLTDRYDQLFAAIASLEHFRKECAHIESRVVRLETSTTAEPVDY